MVMDGPSVQPAPGYLRAHDGGGDIAGGVQPRNRLTAFVRALAVLVDDQAALGA